MVSPLVVTQAVALGATRAAAYEGIAQALAQGTPFRPFVDQFGRLYLNDGRQVLFRHIDKRCPNDVVLAEGAALVSSLAHLARVTSVVTHSSLQALSLPGAPKKEVWCAQGAISLLKSPFQIRQYHECMVLWSDVEKYSITALHSVLQRLDHQSHRALLFIHALGCLDLHVGNIGFLLRGPVAASFRDTIYFDPSNGCWSSLEVLAQQYLAGKVTSQTGLAVGTMAEGLAGSNPAQPPVPLEAIPGLQEVLEGEWELLFFDLDQFLLEDNEFVRAIATAPDGQYREEHVFAFRSDFFGKHANDLTLPPELIKAACDPANDQPLLDWLDHADAHPYMRMSAPDRQRVREAVLAIARKPEFSKTWLARDAVTTQARLWAHFAAQVASKPAYDGLWALLEEVLQERYHPLELPKRTRLAAALCPRVSGRARDIVAQRFQRRRQFLLHGQQLRALHTLQMPKLMASLDAIVRAPSTPLPTAARARLTQDLAMLRVSNDPFLVATMLGTLQGFMQPTHHHIIQAMYPLLTDVEVLYGSVFARHSDITCDPDRPWKKWVHDATRAIGPVQFPIERFLATGLNDFLRAYPLLRNQCNVVMPITRYAYAFKLEYLEKALHLLEQHRPRTISDEWHSLFTVAKAFVARCTNADMPPAFFIEHGVTNTAFKAIFSVPN